MSPRLQVGALIVLGGPIAALNGAVAIAPAVATAPPATAPAVPTAAPTGPPDIAACCCGARFVDFLPAARAGETAIAAAMAQQAMIFAFMAFPPVKNRQRTC